MNTPIAKLPIMPLRSLVIFPNGHMPLSVGRKTSIDAIWRSVKKHDRHIFMVTQRNCESINLHSRSELYDVGTVSKILHIMEMPKQDILKIYIKGLYRARFIPEGVEDTKHKSRKVTSLASVFPFTETNSQGQIPDELRKDIKFRWMKYKYMHPCFDSIIDKYTIPIEDVLSPTYGFLSDSIMQYIQRDYKQHQDFLETSDGMERMHKIYAILKTLPCTCDGFTDKDCKLCKR